jgi:hypothetical protein
MNTDLESWRIHLDNSEDIMVIRFYVPGSSTIGLQYMYYILQDDTFELTKQSPEGVSTILVSADRLTYRALEPTEFSIETLAYHIDPNNPYASKKRCYSSKWKITLEDIDATVTPTVPDQMLNGWIGSCIVSGSDAASTRYNGIAYTYLIHEESSDPEISNVSNNRAYLDTSHDPTKVTAVVTDEIPLKNVSLIYRINDGENQTLEMTQSGSQPNEWTGTIPGQPAVGTLVEYKVIVTNLADDSVESAWESYTIEIG